MPDPTLKDLMHKLERLEERFNHHLGTNPGASIAGTPHPDMSAASRGAYTISNGTSDRSYDADASSTAELADILYTLITDLQTVKILG